MAARPFCVAVDWGTSSFRLWALAADGTVLADRRSDEGLIAAAGKGFSAVLDGHLTALGIVADVPVAMCGMIGARSGWVEAAYLDAPLALAELPTRATRVPHPGRRIVILPGIAQRDPDRPDVIRGEETKLLGLASDIEGLVLMPGTHSKWARLESGRLVDFSTFMTGEIFAALSAGERSVLKEAVKGASAVDPADPAFAQGVVESLDAPELATSRLFGLRAGWLLHGTPADPLLARLSALLIGLEIAGARRRYGDLSGVTLVASGPAGALYAAALSAAGAPAPARREADECVRAGLLRAARELFPINEGAGR